MNILITGGAGFIGSNLTKELIKNGNHMVIFDKKKKSNDLKLFTKDIEYIQGDIRDKRKIDDLFKCWDIDGIIHLAAVSRVIWGEQDPKTCIDININGTKTIFGSIKKSGQKPWFILGSSREVYGEPVELPVSEDCSKKPINIYGITKNTAENMVRDYSLKLGLKNSILRFSNVYGNDKDILDRVIPKFILSALKKEKLEIHGGNQLFDFTHVQDTVAGIINTIELLNKNGDSLLAEDFHILTGRGTSLQEVVKIISEHVNNDLEIIYGKARNYDVDRFIGNPAKAKNFLNFKANILPEKGIPATIDSYREVFDL